MAGSLTPSSLPSGTIRIGSGAVVVSIVSVIPMFLTAGLAVQISADLHLPPAALGAVPAAFFGAMVVGSSVSGRLVGVIGTTRAIRGACLMVATVLVLVAAVATSLEIFLGLLVLGGLANSLAQPATNQLLASHVPWRHQGKAYGAKYSAIPIASMLAGLSVPVLGLTLGWRWAFVTFAVLALLSAMWPFGAVQPPITTPQEALPLADARLPRRLLYVLAIGVGFAAAGGSTLAIFMVASAVDAGWDEGAAGLLLAFASTIGIAARLLSGVLADRRGDNHLRFIVVMLLAGAAGVAGMAVGSEVAFAIAAPLAFAAGWGWPGVFVLTVVRLNPTTPARATGFTQVGTSAGCVLGPFAFGLLVDHTSYGLAWSVNAALLLVGAAILFGGRLAIRAHRRTLVRSTP